MATAMGVSATTLLLCALFGTCLALEAAASSRRGALDALRTAKVDKVAAARAHRMKAGMKGLPDAADNAVISACAADGGEIAYYYIWRPTDASVVFNGRLKVGYASDEDFFDRYKNDFTAMRTRAFGKRLTKCKKELAALKYPGAKGSGTPKQVAAKKQECDDLMDQANTATKTDWNTKFVFLGGVSCETNGNNEQCMDHCFVKGFRGVKGAAFVHNPVVRKGDQVNWLASGYQEMFDFHGAQADPVDDLLPLFQACGYTCNKCTMAGGFTGQNTKCT